MTKHAYAGLTKEKTKRKHKGEDMKKVICFARVSTVQQSLEAQVEAVKRQIIADGYNEEQLRNIWIDDEKNDNFVCVDGDRIIAHISYNPSSKRRNGSIYMINLSVLPEYRRKGVC